MTDEERLADLLLTWEDHFEQGEDIPAKRLCEGRPDLAPALASRIRALRKIAWMKAPAGRPADEDSPSPDGDTNFSQLLAGRYRLDGLIAEGGFGQVWRGFDLELQRPVAVKMPKPSRRTSPERVESLLAEARKVAGLKHPGIVPVYDVPRHEGGYVIVLGLIDGTDLGQHVEGRRLSVREAVRIVVEAAEVLDYAHRQGIIHRDIKPANILLDRTGKVHLTDFGIAATGDESPDHPSDVWGTLPYMAPERRSGKPGPIDSRTDIFSLGVVLCELLTGVRPVPGGTTVQIRGQAAGLPQRPGELFEAALPSCLVRICDRCLAERPMDRYATGKELADDLRNAVAGLMTEEDWRACTDPQLMLSHLYKLNLYSARRKVRLFACACVRQEWHRLVDERGRQAVEVAERYADSQATKADLRAARKAAWEVGEGPHAQAAWVADRGAWRAALETGRLTPRHIQCSLLQDLFGPILFRQPACDPSWLDGNGGTVRRLAQEIYDERAFERMAQLGVALQEAGCDNMEMLDHCSRPGPHVRGCWVVDILLGNHHQDITRQGVDLGQTLEDGRVIERAKGFKLP